MRPTDIGSHLPVFLGHTLFYLILEEYTLLTKVFVIIVTIRYLLRMHSSIIRPLSQIIC
jgi:hypothetical protein